MTGDQAISFPRQELMQVSNAKIILGASLNRNKSGFALSNSVA